MTSPNSGKDRGESMLDKMVTGTLEGKITAAARPLTGLPGEAPTPLVAAPTALIPNHPVLGSLPEDPDLILSRLARARTEVEGILVSIGILETLWGQPATALAAAIQTERVLTEHEVERRKADEATAQSAGPSASKADKKKAEAAAARVAAVAGKDPAAAGEARVDKKAELLKAMMEAEPEVVEQIAAEVDDFTATFAAKSAAAQAATFSGPTSAGHALVETPTQAAAVQQKVTAANPDGWTCPKHGGFTERTSPRRQITFRACPEQGCGEFEKK
jgi:hypothetical protein